MVITNVFQNIHTVHHHATTLMKNSKCVHVIKNVISQRSRFLNWLSLLLKKRKNGIGSFTIVWPKPEKNQLKTSHQKLCSCDYITPGCGCKKGYVRHPSGKCCDPSGCPTDPHPTCGGNCSADKIKSQIKGYGSKDAQCITDGSKNGKGSVWKVSCNGKSSMIKLGKKCKLSNPFCCPNSSECEGGTARFLIELICLEF